VEIRGETIAYAQLDIDTRTSRATPLERGSGETKRVFGPDFTFTAAPTKPIVGTVSDAATGKPLAGVTIESDRIAGSRVYPFDVLRTVTDALGRYRLVGLPKASAADWPKQNEIAAVPSAEQPYFVNCVEVPDTPGLVPVTLDITMTRGVWITGRVTDKLTGKPVPSSLKYFPFRSNPFAANRPEFTRRTSGFLSEMTENVTRPDGSFRLVGLPGRGIVAANTLKWLVRSTPRAMSGTYRHGMGASQIAGMAKNGQFDTFGMPPASAMRNDALQEINPAAGTDSIVCNFVLDPGGTLLGLSDIAISWP
jgi:hypothetical protein